MNNTPDPTDATIDAAEKLASNYDGDDRPHIKTDVINAFYAGAEFARQKLDAASTAPADALMKAAMFESLLHVAKESGFNTVGEAVQAGIDSLAQQVASPTDNSEWFEAVKRAEQNALHVFADSCDHTKQAIDYMKVVMDCSGPYAPVAYDKAQTAAQQVASPTAKPTSGAGVFSSRGAFEAWARTEGHTNFMRMAGDPETYDDLILRAQFKSWSAAGAVPVQAPNLTAALQRMRSAFHTNMLRAFPDKSHEEIAAEIDRACGLALSVQAQPVGLAPNLADLRTLADKLVRHWGDLSIDASELMALEAAIYVLTRADHGHPAA